MSLPLCREKTQSSEQGSILVYCVIFILFLSSLGFFFRVTSMPTVTPTADTRRLYEAQYVMDSAKTVIRNQLWPVGSQTLNKEELLQALNGIKTITLQDSLGNEVTITRTARVQNADIEITPLGKVQKVTVKNMKFKIMLSDGSIVRRTRTWVFDVNQWS